MKLSNLEQVSKIHVELDKILRKLGREVTISDMTSVTISPTGQLNTNTDVILKISSVSREKDLFFWIALSYYIDPKYSVYFRVLFQERYLVKISSLEKRELALLCLEDKDLCQSVLIGMFSTTNSLFGWLLQPREELKIKILLRERRDLRVYQKKKHSRHRGYRDKGSLGDGLHLDQEYHSDVWIAVAEETFLKNQKIQKDLSNFLQETDFFG